MKRNTGTVRHNKFGEKKNGNNCAKKKWMLNRKHSYTVGANTTTADTKQQMTSINTDSIFNNNFL